MPIEVHCERRIMGLFPLTPKDEEEMQALPIGAHVKVKITRQRSRPLLRFYWATIEEAADAIGLGKEELSRELLCATKRVDAYYTKRNELFVIPKRISHMDRDELRAYVNDAISLLFSDYLAPESKGELFKVASQKARTTFEDAMRALENEGNDAGWERITTQEPKARRQAAEHARVDHV